ncbi:hypothetical protein HDU97_009542 [Phlyctochytrium planicorne]|nr:hypothetical protein HDU97_009542 [Phlyctochytrium planicorne]
MAAIYNYFFPKAPFSFEEIPDLTSKVVIVTGASSGLGLVSTVEMAKKGAHVIMAVRSVKKAEEVLEEAKKKNPQDKLNVTIMEVDLSSLASVRNFAEAFTKLKLPLHILMNNAGVMAIDKFTLSTDGIEMQLHANHLGHFYLTTLLLPILEETSKKSDASVRVVNLSSFGHNFAKAMGVDFEGYNDPEKYSPWPAYGQSKLCNILFTKELQKRLEAKGYGNIRCNAVHPGGVSTNLASQSTHSTQYMPSWVVGLMPYFLATPEYGALSQLYAATSPEIDSKKVTAEYFVPTCVIGTTTALGTNAELAKDLWEWSERVIKEKGFSLTLK